MTTKQTKRAIIAILLIQVLTATAMMQPTSPSAAAQVKAAPDKNAEQTVPSPMYGDKKSYITIGVYTDYMSKNSLEANNIITPIIPQLAKNASIYFAEVPTEHIQSIKYSEAFLSVHLANSPNDINTLLHARTLLFQAAATQPKADPLQVLKKNGVPYKHDTQAIGIIFKQFYIPLIIADNITTEPVVVVHKGQQKFTYYGPTQIKKGLTTLLESFIISPDLQRPKQPTK